MDNNTNIDINDITNALATRIGQLEVQLAVANATIKTLRESADKPVVE